MTLAKRADALLRCVVDERVLDADAESTVAALLRDTRSSSAPVHVKVGSRFIGYVWVPEPSHDTLQILVSRLRSDFGRSVKLSVPTSAQFDPQALPRLLQYEN
jgi:hypothetical protein